MTSQGWTPGSYLGARNASHSDTFTAASASHIKVTLKDDTLGLGARAPTLGNENVAAIDALQGLLGRLNGKSDTQLEEEQRKRDDTRLALYARTKWHAVNFISGGYLVQEKPDDACNRSRKKKRDSSDDTTSAKREARVTSRDRSTDNTDYETEKSGSIAKDKKKEKKSKQDREGKKEKSNEKSQKNKRDKREKKEKRKDKNKGEKERGRRKDKNDKPKKRRRISADDEDMDGESSDSSTTDVPDTNITTSQAQRPTWRHAIRGRHIQQKRMAVMNDRSLGEVSPQFNLITSQVDARILTASDLHAQSLMPIDIKSSLGNFTTIP